MRGGKFYVCRLIDKRKEVSSVAVTHETKDTDAMGGLQRPAAIDDDGVVYDEIGGGDGE